MTNGQNLVNSSQLASISSAVKNYISSEIASVGGGGNASSVFIGASQSSEGIEGLVPAPDIGDQNKFLRGDGAFAMPLLFVGTAPSTVEGAIWLEDD